MPRRKQTFNLGLLPAALLIAGLLAGCSASRQASGDKPQQADDQIRTAEATFRPSDHDPKQARVQAMALQTADSARAQNSGDSALPTAGEMVQGFRVQAFSTTSIDLARAKKADLEGMFPGEWFYMDYASPNYKIRAGNFVTKLDADRFARVMNELGFVDAWPVPERVYKNIGRRPLPPPPPEQQPEIK
jgi:hypothetical protein